MLQSTIADDLYNSKDSTTIKEFLECDSSVMLVTLEQANNKGFSKAYDNGRGTYLPNINCLTYSTLQ
ncbi:MAG: hypothetical protein MASP_00183 [Candidatus Methanolliviera sp. GoM_asphalt]|nr:MAG: hypothetical protein MASP_00183 [Candidatus Methanolliviera sp. GoM_asphalt]